ncbi:UNVERIFIED_CONTAM: aromatic amino acid hydrolase AAH2, partial [Hammondia hammondi]
FVSLCPSIWLLFPLRHCISFGCRLSLFLSLEVRQWRPEDAAQQDFPITTYQPVLYVAESLKDARDSLLRYIQNHIHKPFATRYDNATRTLHVSTDVHMPPVSVKI